MSPLTNQHLQRFVVKTKHVQVPTPNEESLGEWTDEEKQLYMLHKHLLFQGPAEKVMKSNVSAMRLTTLSKYYLDIGSLSKASLLANMATKLALSNHTAYSLTQLALLESDFIAARAQGLEKIDFVLSLFQRAMTTVEFHWGQDHPVSLSLYDKMTHLLSKADRPEKAQEYLDKSLSLAKRVLGPAHVVTAGYLTKVFT